MEIEKDYSQDFVDYPERACYQKIELDEPEEPVAEKEQGILYRKSNAFRAMDPVQTVNHMEEGIKEVAGTFGIDESAAFSQMKQNGWDLQKTMINIAENFVDLESPQLDETIKEFECPVCYAIETVENASSFGCSHFYCKDCLKEYVRVAIDENQPLKTCPTEGCKEVLTPDLCSQYFRDDQKIFNKYLRFLVKTIIDTSHSLLWCPGTGCNNAIQLLQIKKTDNVPLNIRCSCGYCFCLNCKDVAHRPLSCEHFAKWKAQIAKIAENEEELLNKTWIERHSKPCPECKVNIEKNQGCMHMTCSKCRHEFCWICLGDWRNHLAQGCNQFNQPNRQSFDNQEVENFYIKRFSHHHSALQHTLKKQKIIMDNFRYFNSKVQYPVDEAFLQETLNIIFDARRAISMTYAAGDLRRSVGLSVEMHEFQQSLLWQALEILDKFTDSLQSKEKMEDLLVTHVQGSMLFYDKFNNFKRRLDEKTYEVIKACNNLLIEMEKDNSLLMFFEQEHENAIRKALSD